MPFISIEGIDGSGKTCQTELLAKSLMQAGKIVVQTKEPDKGHLGLEVRAILTHPQRVLSPMEQLLLVSAARYDHVRSVIRPALDAGKWVVSDRYLDSTYAFQVAVSDTDLERVYNEVMAVVVGATMPDLTIVLDLSVDVALERRRSRILEGADPAEATRDFQSIREGLLSVAHRDLKRCRVVDGAQLPKAVAQDIWLLIQPLL